MQKQKNQFCVGQVYEFVDVESVPLLASARRSEFYLVVDVQDSFDGNIVSYVPLLMVSGNDASVPQPRSSKWYRFGSSSHFAVRSKLL
jgi:hypothetical protein